MIAKNIRRYFSLKEIVVVLLAITISVSAGVGVFFSCKKDVTINDDGKLITAKTMKSTVSEVLEQNGIKVKVYDYINLQTNAKLHRILKNEIVIKRAVPVNIIADGQTKQLMTYQNVIGDLLQDGSITLVEKDRLEGTSVEDKIVSNMDIKIIRVREEVLTEKIPIPFKTISKENNKLNKGAEVIVKEGIEGLREKSYKVLYQDGLEIKRDIVADNVLVNPIDRLMELGTVMNYKTSRGEVLRYKKVLDMRATAYTASYADTGKHPGDPAFGITFTGVKAKKGIIAVDPRVIPLGTRVYVEVMGKISDYGYAVAADTGGAIKGNLIDLYLDDQNTVDQWGVKNVKVYFLVD